MTFESNLDRLDAIVSALDGEELSLEDALRLFEEGLEKLRLASADLDRAEARVQQLVENADGSFDVRALDA